MTDPATAIVEVSYAMGWDFATRSVLYPLNETSASERDRKGRPYVVVYGTLQRRYPLEVHLVSWNDHYFGIWAYDEQGRRVAGADLRLVEPDRLFMRRMENWHYTTSDMPEFAWDAGQDSIDHPNPQGPGQHRLAPQGNAGPSIGQGWSKDDQIWYSKPRFGKPALLLRGTTRQISGPLTFREAPMPAQWQGSSSLLAGASCPWEPPHPALPGQLGALFQPGARIAYIGDVASHEEIVTVVDPVDVGEVSIPSGRLIVDMAYVDRDYPDTDRRVRELSERIPAGTYRVQAAMVREDWEYQGRSGSNVHSRAVRLVLAPEPAVTWELALCENDDLRLLQSGDVVGYLIDNGDDGCFADASAWEALADQYACWFDDGDDSGIERLADGFTCVHDKASGGDMIAFPAAGGRENSVWLGRAESGQLVAILAATSPLVNVRLL
ncbi:DUF4241 domain-containing protein [Nocardia sp. NBC_00565]|uniref:DUF4241 domain-containing protein n=1 Tax=Nocardia sp. NBC_00565 TaxID=2975993 RepID=UPI002E80D7E7|nr:DUF4241 domain-containing protein [Nocardia sp. NBC_00565]WUC00287.1 DUF4241 domain-containing protein [Nocardia sp. NBC_00565]